MVVDFCLRVSMHGVLEDLDSWCVPLKVEKKQVLARERESFEIRNAAKVRTSDRKHNF